MLLGVLHLHLPETLKILGLVAFDTISAHLTLTAELPDELVDPASCCASPCRCLKGKYTKAEECPPSQTGSPLVSP